MLKQPALHRDGYAVFVRVHNLGSNTPADTYAHVIDALDELLFKQIHNSEHSFFPNPNGGAIYLPGIVDALRASRELIQALASQYVHVTIGIAWGRFERISNVATWNSAAQPLNVAARLAFATGAQGHVLVTPEVARDALLASDRYQNSFSEPLVCCVKGREYPYRFVTAAEYKQNVGGEFLPRRFETRPASILLCDIGKYSQRSADEQAVLSETLAKHISAALIAIGAPSSSYNPSGDGGYVVMDSGEEHSGERAVLLASQLRRRIAHDIPLRIGISNGPVAATKRRNAVGGAIIRAEEISCLSSAAGFAVSKRVWESIPQPAKNGWAASTGGGAPDVVVIEQAPTDLGGVKLEHQNHLAGVSLSIQNFLPKSATFRLTLLSMDRIQGVEYGAFESPFMPIPISSGQQIECGEKGDWRPLAVSTKRDFSEFKIESIDGQVPSLFVRRPGLWRLKIEVSAEGYSRNIELWMRWTVGDPPVAIDRRNWSG
jgi:hypothetical protein